MRPSAVERLRLSAIDCSSWMRARNRGTRSALAVGEPLRDGGRDETAAEPIECAGASRRLTISDLSQASEERVGGHLDQIAELGPSKSSAPS